MTPDNDDTPPSRLIPLLGVLDIDNGCFEAATIVQLLHDDMLRLFPNDAREA